MQPVQLSLMPDPPRRHRPAPRPAGAAGRGGRRGDRAAGRRDRQGRRARRGWRRPAMSERKVTAVASAAGGGGLCPPVHAGAGRPQPGVHRPPVRPGRAGRAAGLAAQRGAGDRRRPRASAGPAPPAARGSPSWPPRSGSGRWGSCCRWSVSRLARNNADWYRLLDLAGMTDTLIADADGVYHPGLFNDRLLLGMKGTMSEAELHILRARLDGGIRNKAARGELRRGLPVGLVWGEADGEIRWHPDEAVTGVIAAIFERFAVCGSVRGVWLWLREQGLRFPLQPTAYLRGEEITWVEPTYHAVHNVLTHPAYAGAYVFGKTRQQRYRRRGRPAAHQPPQAAPGRVGGAHHRPPPRVHRLGHLPGQPGPHRRQHPPAGAPAGHRRGPRGLRAAARAGHLRDAAAASSPSTTTARPSPPPATTAPAPASSSRAAAPGTCASAASRSTPPSPPRSWPRCSPPRCRPAWPPPSNSRTATTPRSRSGDARSSRPATRPAGPSAATGPSTPTTGWSPAVWKPSGTPRCNSSPTPRNELARREHRAPENPDPARETGDPRPRRRPRRGVVGGHHHRQGPQDSCCAPCWTRSASACTATTTKAAPISLLRWKGGAITELSVPLKRKPPQRLRTERGHHRPAAPPGRALPRRHDRRDPQPATPPHRPGTVVHRQ